MHFGIMNQVIMVANVRVFTRKEPPETISIELLSLNSACSVPKY